MPELLSKCEREGARTVLLADAENLFGGKPSQTHRRLEALCHWVDRVAARPWLGRIYGNRARVASKWTRLDAVLAANRLTHVDNPVGKDAADRNLEADLHLVRDLGVQVVLGSADYKSINRCRATLSSSEAATTLSWLVLTPVESRRGSHPFAEGEALAWFPVDRVVTMDRIYESWVLTRPQQSLVAPKVAWRAHQPRGYALPPAEWWRGIRPRRSLRLDSNWARSASARISEVLGIPVLDADELVRFLREWLPIAIPTHYHDNLTQLEDDAWAYQCLVALLAAALTPGRNHAACYGVLLSFSGELDELHLEAKLRALTLHRDRYVLDQGGLVQLLAR